MGAVVARPLLCEHLLTGAAPQEALAFGSACRSASAAVSRFRETIAFALSRPHVELSQGGHLRDLSLQEWLQVQQGIAVASASLQMGAEAFTRGSECHCEEEAGCAGDKAEFAFDSSDEADVADGRHVSRKMVAMAECIWRHAATEWRRAQGSALARVVPAGGGGGASALPDLVAAVSMTARYQSRLLDDLGDFAEGYFQVAGLFALGDGRLALMWAHASWGDTGDQCAGDETRFAAFVGHDLAALVRLSRDFIREHVGLPVAPSPPGGPSHEPPPDPWQSELAGWWGGVPLCASLPPEWRAVGHFYRAPV